MEETFELNVNGHTHSVTTDKDRPLLDVLREDLRMTGAKYGCGEGECGACTVLVDGEAVRSCITPIGTIDGGKIETIEGLAAEGELHSVQRAFIEKRAMQCGFCVPGQIMAAVAMLREKKNPSRDEIIEAMSDNICRCCNYPNILSAVEHAAG